MDVALEVKGVRRGRGRRRVGPSKYSEAVTGPKALKFEYGPLVTSHVAEP